MYLIEQHKGARSVTERHLFDSLPSLPHKMIYSVLAFLKHKDRQILHCEQQYVIPKGRGSKGKVYKTQTGHIYYIDYVHFVRVIRYRFHKIFEQLNKKESDIHYMCPSPTCSQHGAPLALLDLLGSVDNHTVFLCQHCKTGLVLHTDGLSTQERVRLKPLFNTQIKPILDQMATVEELLHRSPEEREEGEEKKKEEEEVIGIVPESKPSDEEYRKRYTSELQRMMQLSAHHEEENEEEDDVDLPTLTVKGVVVDPSLLTQQELDEMTPEELGIYDTYYSCQY
jgi:hypothetical protein